MDNVEIGVLEYFTMPKCLKCGTAAEIVQTDNGACNDPECCGGTIEYTELRCPTCKVTEDMRNV